jgi:hypothetical protein
VLFLRHPFRGEQVTAGQKTVIIVEDEQDSAEMFVEMMRVNDFRVLKESVNASAAKLIAK